MKIFKDILYKVSLTSTVGNMEVKVNALAFDSRQVKEGTVFVAIKGTQVDGHEYIEKALESGAIAIVCEQLPVLASAWHYLCRSPEYCQGAGDFSK